jgi:hypothetical protein
MEIVIKNNRFVCRIYDMDSFIEMPLKNIRKLWKLMFAESWRNEESIENLEQWLINTCALLGFEAEAKEWELVHAAHCAEESRKLKESYGSVVTNEIKKAELEARKNAKRAEAAHKQSKRNFAKAEKLNIFFHELAQI